MAETKPSENGKNREKQPISVPFVWEHAPGIPKKDWKPTPARPNNPITQPVKLVVSVPFGWEQKPGTPLPSFLQQTPNDLILPSSQNSDRMFEKSSAGNGRKTDYQGQIEGDGSSLDSCSSEMYDSFSSARSATNPFLSSVDDITEQDSETESCITRTRSLAGESFLEWLFPLLVTNLSEPKYNEVECLETGSVTMKELLQENNPSQVRRPLLTLGELIVMSRRRSCQRKITKLHKQTSMDFTKGNVLGCCIFGANRIGMLPVKLRRQLQLK